MRTRLLSILLAVLFVAGMVTVPAAAADFPFVDVSPEAWYYNDVKTAYEGGLVNGKTTTTFCPTDNLTYAEAVKLAACMHQKYTTGVVSLVNGDPWYKSFADYAKMNGIISKDYGWNDKATRAGYMEIFANALPDSALTAKNDVPDGSIPDVSMAHPQAAAIYKLYRAGILQGSDDTYGGVWTRHLCKPADPIKRSEVAAILTRMMFVDKRLPYFSMAPETDNSLKITKQPQSYTLKAPEETVSFSAEISGGKAPYTYKWVIEKETGTNPTSGTSDKQTSSFQVSVRKDSFDFSKYMRVYVVVTDADSKSVTSDKAEITPYTAGLKITKQPAAYQMKSAADTEASFTVEISGGKAPYKYQWIEELDGTPTWYNEFADVKETKNTFPVKNASLLLASAKSVKVYCVVTDAEGKNVASDKADLLPFSASGLKITKQPQTAEVASGASYTASIEVTGGTAPYTYDWQTANKNETPSWSSFPALNNGKSTFVFQNLMGMYYLGLYRCVVTDAAGKTVTSDVFEILDPAAGSLKITKQPKDVKLTSAADTAVFEVAVSGGTAPYTYKWLFDLMDGTVFDYETTRSETSMSLPVDNGANLIAMSKDGTVEVWCEITDDAGKSVKSDKAKLTAGYSADGLEAFVDKTTVNLASHSENYSLTASAKGGTEPYSYQWWWGLTTVIGPGADQMHDMSEWTPNFGKASIYASPDTRYYKYYMFCRVTDQNGNYADTPIVTITIGGGTSEGLTITSHPKDYQMDSASDKPTFTVSVKGGKPPYTYTWYADNGIGKNTYKGNADGTFIMGDGYELLEGSMFDVVLVWCEVKDADGKTEKSNSAVLTRVVASSPLYAFADKVAEGFRANVTGGTSPYAYQWQSRKKGGSESDWKDMAYSWGRNQILEMASNPVTLESEYRCRVTDKNGEVYYTGAIYFN